MNNDISLSLLVLVTWNLFGYKIVLSNIIHEKFSCTHIWNVDISYTPVVWNWHNISMQLIVRLLYEKCMFVNL